MDKILIVGDLHLYNKTPISRIDKYEETILNKLDKILEMNYNIIIFTGDIFHKLNISKDYIEKVISVFYKYKDKRIYTIVGNHDILHNDIAYIKDSPLGILFSTHFINPLDRLITDEYEIIGWNYSERDKYPITDKESVLIAHEFASDLNDNDWSKFNNVVLGHDHLKYDIKKMFNTTLYRPGAVGRLTSAEKDINKIYFVDLNNKCYIDMDVEKNVWNSKNIELKKELKISKSNIQVDSIEEVLKKFDFDDNIKREFLDLYKEIKNAGI